MKAMGKPLLDNEKTRLLEMIYFKDWDEKELQLAIEDGIMGKNDLLMRLGKIRAISAGSIKEEDLEDEPSSLLVSMNHTEESVQLEQHWNVVDYSHKRAESADTLPDKDYEDPNDQTVIWAPIAKKPMLHFVDQENQQGSSLGESHSIEGVSFGELTIQLLNELAQKHSESGQESVCAQSCSGQESVYATPKEKDETGNLLDSVCQKPELLMDNESEPLDPTGQSMMDVSGEEHMLGYGDPKPRERSSTVPSLPSTDKFQETPNEMIRMPGSFHSHSRESISSAKRSITPANPLPQIPTQTSRPSLPAIPTQSVPTIPTQKRGLRTLDLEKQDRRRWTVDWNLNEPIPQKKKSILDFFTFV